MTATLRADCSCTPDRPCRGSLCDECWRRHGCPVDDAPEDGLPVDEQILALAAEHPDVVAREETRWVVRNGDGVEVYVANDEPTALSERAYTPGGTVETIRVLTITFRGGAS